MEELPFVVFIEFNVAVFDFCKKHPYDLQEEPFLFVCLGNLLCSLRMLKKQTMLHAEFA